MASTSSEVTLSSAIQTATIISNFIEDAHKREPDKKELYERVKKELIILHPDAASSALKTIQAARDSLNLDKILKIIINAKIRDALRYAFGTEPSAADEKTSSVFTKTLNPEEKGKK